MGTSRESPLWSWDQANGKPTVLGSLLLRNPRPTAFRAMTKTRLRYRHPEIACWPRRDAIVVALVLREVLMLKTFKPEWASICRDAALRLALRQKGAKALKGRRSVPHQTNRAIWVRMGSMLPYPSTHGSSSPKNQAAKALLRSPFPRNQGAHELMHE
ncbi:MAG: hypothetical protein U1F57_11840 [bacterium]